ncbi:MAG: ABC transporter permease [Prolixibacteraceae bacterium]|nr:ABC transporter permease [Prolixibacteraceae bacterium]
MIKTLIKTAFRNFKKDRFHFILNIAGLALGLAAFLYIATYVSHEINFDRFHSKSDRIYRCVAFLKMGDVETNFAKSELPLAEAAKHDLPEVDEATRIVQENNLVVRHGEQKFVEDEIWFADPNLFKVFDFNLIEGDKNTVLSDPYSILISEKMAEKYFGKADPVGKSLEIGDSKDVFVVKGILGKIPDDSHLQFDMLASFNSLAVSRRVDYWGDFSVNYTYLLLKEGTNLDQFNKKFLDFPIKYWGPMMESAIGKSLEEWKSEGNYLRYDLQPLKKIHLNTTFQEELKNQGNSQSLMVFTITGLFILIIACFNFINLSTAKATLRAKEIGLKKIIGSSRTRIILQIHSETFIYSILALLLAVIILILTMPVLNNFSGINLKPGYLLNSATLATVLLIPLVITVSAGSYPAVYITRFKPEEVLNRKFTSGKKSSYKRATLVSVQFAIFIILICGSLVIRKQIVFLHNQNPGFNKENVLVVKGTSRLNNNRKAFKNLIKQDPGVINATYASVMPSADNDESNIFSEKGKKEQVLLKRIRIDPDFQKTLNIEMVNGRFFSDEINSEKRNAIINEEAARIFGWTDCENKILYDYNNGGGDYKVIGIVKNFHMKSLREKAEPAIIRITDQENYLAVRIASGQAYNTLTNTRAEWNELNNDAPFEYFFLDENFDAQYRKEEQLGKLIGVFTLIAILIACLGLFGLVSFTAVQRQKEIGVRKVNGANIFEVLIMLNKDIILWILIAFLFACPLAYFAMNKWLENFAFKTSLSWWIFVLAGVLALGIALLTVSFQTWKAATKNPVEALRYE